MLKKKNKIIISECDITLPSARLWHVSLLLFPGITNAFPATRSSRQYERSC